MKRHTFLWIAALVMMVSLSAQAAQFTMKITVNDSVKGSWLTFGLGAQRELLPVPPIFYASSEILSWLEGPGDIDVAYTVDDYSKLTEYVKQDANSALWKVFVRDEQKYTFNLSSGSLPSGSVLKIYPEGDEANAVILEDGTNYNVQANTTYLIDYRETSSTAQALAAPGVKRFQMSRGAKTLVLDFDIPEGYTLKADSNVIAYGAFNEDLLYPVLDGKHGSFNATTSTLTMTNMEGVARVQFNYWYAQGATTSEKGLVIVDVNDSLATTLVSRVDVATSEPYTGAVVTVDPEAAGYAGTVLTYKIDFDNATLGQPLTYNVETPLKLPGIDDAYAVEYAFSTTEDYTGDYTALPEGGIAYTSNAATMYLKLKVTLTSKCESGEVEPSITTGASETIAMKTVVFYVVGGGTMDIDGNGEIIVEDAIMMYNFIALGGVTRPNRVTERQITQGVDTSKVDSAKALETLRSLAAFLDYDENGEIIVEDAIMMYNFIALGGVTRPNRVTERQITQGVDTSKVEAAKALENFRKYVSK